MLARNFAILLLALFTIHESSGFDLSPEQEEGMPDFGDPVVSTPVIDVEGVLGSSHENQHTCDVQFHVFILLKLFPHGRLLVG
jgi:hypothetical protein